MRNFAARTPHSIQIVCACSLLLLCCYHGQFCAAAAGTLGTNTVIQIPCSWSSPPHRGLHAFCGRVVEMDSNGIVLQAGGSLGNRHREGLPSWKGRTRPQGCVQELGMSAVGLPVGGHSAIVQARGGWRCTPDPEHRRSPGNLRYVLN